MSSCYAVIVLQHHRKNWDGVLLPGRKPAIKRRMPSIDTKTLGSASIKQLGIAPQLSFCLPFFAAVAESALDDSRRAVALH